jgi:hypothetical protein
MEGATQDLDVPVAVVADPDRPQAEWAIGRRAEDEMLEFDIGGPSVGGHEALHVRFLTLQAAGFIQKYEHILLESTSFFSRRFDA